MFLRLLRKVLCAVRPNGQEEVERLRTEQTEAPSMTHCKTASIGSGSNWHLEYGTGGLAVELVPKELKGK